MLTYIVRRTLMAIPLLLGITIISFAIIRLAPGDPTTLLMDPTISPADKAKFMEKYGLNDPVHIQYLKWLGSMVQGDFGTSLIRKGVPVSEMIEEPFAEYVIANGCLNCSSSDHCHSIWHHLCSKTLHKS